MSPRRMLPRCSHAVPLAVLVLTLLCPPVAAATDPPTVAIADLDNHTGDPALDGAGAGVAAVLISKFARTDAIQVVERARLHELIVYFTAAHCSLRYR